MRRLLLPLMLLPQLLFAPATAVASATLQISEVAWAGSIDSASDEWIELRNSGVAAVDLSGFRIVDDGATTYALSGSVPAGGYFLLEKRQEATSVPADLVVAGIGLANDGDRLTLIDASGAVLDEVNPAGGAWPAGSATTKGSMARGTDGSWATATESGRATSSLGGAVVGTPRTANAGPATAGLALLHTTTTAQAGSTITVDLQASGTVGAVSFGAEVRYDPAVLSFVEARSGGLLGATVATSFQAGLLDGLPGTIVLGEAQTTSQPSGAVGDGILAVLTFAVPADARAGTTTVSLDPASFVATALEDLPLTRTDLVLTVESAASPVTGLVASPAAGRYTIALTWSPPATGAEAYRVYRTDPLGTDVLLGTTAATTFTDEGTAGPGGNIVPTHTYAYTVRSVAHGIESDGATVSAVDPRGILGDSTRDDRTDGRDLALLGRSWGSGMGEAAYAPLTDTSVDGAVDADDLVHLARNWARTYTP